MLKGTLGHFISNDQSPSSQFLKIKDHNLQIRLDNFQESGEKKSFTTSTCNLEISRSWKKRRFLSFDARGRAQSKWRERLEFSREFNIVCRRNTVENSKVRLCGESRFRSVSTRREPSQPFRVVSTSQRNTWTLFFFFFATHALELP